MSTSNSTTDTKVIVHRTFYSVETRSCLSVRSSAYAFEETDAEVEGEILHLEEESFQVHHNDSGEAGHG